MSERRDLAERLVRVCVDSGQAPADLIAEREGKYRRFSFVFGTTELLVRVYGPRFILARFMTRRDRSFVLQTRIFESESKAAAFARLLLAGDLAAALAVDHRIDTTPRLA